MESLHQLMNSGLAAQTIVMVNAADLKQAIDRIVMEVRLSVEEQHRPVYLTREEVTELLHISDTTFYNFIKAGKLKPVMVGGHKRYIRSEIDEAVRTGRLRKYLHKKRYGNIDFNPDGTTVWP